MERQPNTIYVASISYGKDSLAMLEAIKRLGYPLDRIVSVQVWATDTIPADLPEMYEWKNKADEIIYAKYGLRVERVTATKNDRQTNYAECFYTPLRGGKYRGEIKGFPQTNGGWCGKLKYEYFNIRRYILLGHKQGLATVSEREPLLTVFENGAIERPFHHCPKVRRAI